MRETYLFSNEEVYRTEYFVVGQDWEVPIPGFMIVSPVREVRSIADFTQDEVVDFALTTHKVRRGMRDVLGIEEIYLFQNEDTAHNFHLWMFPRYEWMEGFGRKVQSVRMIMSYAEKWIEEFDRDFGCAQKAVEGKVREEIIDEVRAYAARMRAYMNE